MSASSPRSVLRDHRGIEVIVQAGAEDMLVHLGAVDGGDRGSPGNRNCEGTRRCAEIDIEILGLRGPVVAEQSDQEGEGGFDATADGPAALGVGDFYVAREAEERGSNLGLDAAIGVTAGGVEQCRSDRI